MRQTLFLLVIAALWLGACSHPRATTTVDDLTHGVREYLKQCEISPAICHSGEETPDLIATYNEELAGAASQLLSHPSARTMPLEELAAVFEDGCDRTADVHFYEDRTGVVLGTWDVAHCPRGSHDYPPVGFFVFDREGHWWDMGRSGLLELVVPTSNGWVVTVNLSTSAAYAPFQVRHIRRVGDGWEMKVLYDYYTGTTHVEDGYRHLVVGFDLAYFLPPCEFVPEIEGIIRGIPTAHDGTVVFEWDGDGYELVRETYDVVVLISPPDANIRVQLEDWEEYFVEE